MKFVDRVRKNLSTIAVQESLKIAARDIVAEMRPRIFDDGKDTDGNDIGTYSTNPLYIKKVDMSRTGGGEDAGDSKYFAGGYAAYKRSLGRGRNYDLRNFGVMMRDFLAPKETLTDNSIKYEFKQQRNQEIADRYPKAFGLNAKEKERFAKTFNFELALRLFQ